MIKMSTCCRSLAFMFMHVSLDMCTYVWSHIYVHREREGKNTAMVGHTYNLCIWEVQRGRPAVQSQPGWATSDPASKHVPTHRNADGVSQAQREYECDVSKGF